MPQRSADHLPEKLRERGALVAEARLEEFDGRPGQDPGDESATTEIEVAVEGVPTRPISLGIYPKGSERALCVLHLSRSSVDKLKKMLITAQEASKKPA